MREEISRILDNIGKVIIGKDPVIEKLLAAVLADGHVLLEDVPGTGKTKMAKALAVSMGSSFNRIQFTPDMLPSDITGLNVYNRKENEFELKKGPVFTNIILADEINRATPRTQAGLLECMEERQVTIDGVTYPLEEPFFVIATQNPVETAGTFPLPEAQMDRFMMKLSMGTPEREEEIAILDRYMTGDPGRTLEAVTGALDIMAMREEVKQVYVHPLLRAYLVDVASATRKRGKVIMGVSPRGTLALLRCIKAYAWMQGRAYCIPDDIKYMAADVFAHRILLSYGGDSSRDTDRFVKEILDEVPVPTEDFGN